MCIRDRFRNISRPQTKNRLISKEKKAVFLRSKVVTASKNVEINSLASQCFREKKSNGSNSPQNPFHFVFVNVYKSIVAHFRKKIKRIGAVFGNWENKFSSVMFSFNPIFERKFFSAAAARPQACSKNPPSGEWGAH